jgi:hypothetical protein
MGKGLTPFDPQNLTNGGHLLETVPPENSSLPVMY